MYSHLKCAVKINNMETDFFPQSRGVKQGCSLSPTLFNIYIDELAKSLELSDIPGLTLSDTQVKCLLFADDLILLAPSNEALQQQLDHLQTFCQTWALTVNLDKTKIMIFQKRPRGQGDQTRFFLGSHEVEHTHDYTYLGLHITSTGNFNLAVDDLREKGRRAFYAIKKSSNINIPIRIWLKIFKSIIEPIILYGSEVWGPLANQDFEKWDKHPIEILHTEICKSILRVHRNTPNNGCRAELGQFPLLIRIQKRAIKFYKHLKTSDPNSYHYKALQCQEESMEKSPLSQLVLSLSSSNSTRPQDSPHTIWTHQIIEKQKEHYINYWTSTTKMQSKLQCYLALNRQYTVAEYLSTVTDEKLRKTLTMYRLSDHSLAIETGRHRQTWLPREDRLCELCPHRQAETETHFLLHCSKYEHIRADFLSKIKHKVTDFDSLPDQTKMQHILGENRVSSLAAAKYVRLCHSLRDNHHNT